MNFNGHIKLFLLTVCCLLPLQAWGQEAESISVKIYHLPTTAFTIFRADLTAEPPTATGLHGFGRYDYEAKSWTDIFTDSTTHRLVESQRRELLRRAAGIDVLLPDSAIGIDGNYYDFTHRRGDSVYTYGSFSDTPDSLADYLYDLFELPGAVTIMGQVGYKIVSDGCLDTSNCWDGLPLARVSLLSPSGETIASTLADDQAVFELTVLPTRCSLAISHPGYVTRIISHIVLTEDLELGHILLPPGDPKRAITTPYNILSGNTTSGAVISHEDLNRIPSR